MNTPLLHARQTKYALYAASYILIVLAILVVANVLAATSPMIRLRTSATAFPSRRQKS